MMKSVLLLCVFCYALGAESVTYYYWRNYTGVIPDDAVLAGFDLHLRPTYIGRVLSPDHNVQIIRIYPQIIKDYIIAEAPEVRTDTFILCSPNKQRFLWVPVNTKNWHIALPNQHLVRAGTENDHLLNIGRTNYYGELLVGKAVDCNLGNAKLSFVYNNVEKNVRNFDVLVYDVPPVVQYSRVVNVTLI